MFIKTKAITILMAAALVMFLLVLANNFVYLFYLNSDSVISLSLVNPCITEIAADSSNRVMLKITVRSWKGLPIKNVPVKISVSNSEGTVKLLNARTDRNGESVAVYTPREDLPNLRKDGRIGITLTASAGNSRIKSSLKLEQVPVPVVLVHGYQASAAIFENVNDYLKEQKFLTFPFEYNSLMGVTSGARELNLFLSNRKKELAASGVQVERFDLVAHSMGGLVARYYSCSREYLKGADIRKIVFVSVPHKGSHMASMGESCFNDQGIHDLVPGSTLITKTLSSMLNKGLSSTIQVGNILGQYDEVVTPESASLEEWGIKTELFSIGENNFTVGNLLSGNIIEAQNHKIILNNKKVCEKIVEMLRSNLPYPIKR